MEKIAVVVEDVDAARTALQWALHNILRYGDLLTLLHVYSIRSPSAIAANRRNNKKKKNLRRRLRLRGFQLALSFRDICTNAGFSDTKMEIVVTEAAEEEDEGRIAAIIREIGASTLVLGLHERSFLYKLLMAQNNVTRYLNCKVLAIRERSTSTSTISFQASSTNMDFSQIEIPTLSIPEALPQKIHYQICPDPYAIIWRSKQSRSRRTS